MNVRVMRMIDRFAGVPLGLMVGFGLKLVGRRRPESTFPKRILVMKFFGMGSIVLSTPALALLKTAYPSARITYLSFEKNREILERLSIIDEIVTVKTESMSMFLNSLAAAISHLRTSRYEVAVDLEFFSKFSTILAALSFAPVRAGFSLPTLWRRLLLTHQIAISKDKHVSEAFADVCRSITGNSMPIPPIASLTVYDTDRNSLALKLGNVSGRLIIINANAGETFIERRWPAERFAEVVREISPRIDSTFVLIGLSSEREISQVIVKQVDANHRLINLVGSLSVGELLALIERADLMLTNDSGPGHLAAIMGCGVVSLFGPESPQFYGPIGDSVSVIYKAIACSPCMNVYAAKSFRCPYDARCMKEITVNEVVKSVERAIFDPEKVDQA